LNICRFILIMFIEVLGYTWINQTVFRRMSNPHTSDLVRGMHFPNLVHSLVFKTKYQTSRTINGKIWIPIAYLSEWLDAWKQHIFSFKFSIQNCGFEDIVHYLFRWKPGTIAKSWWIYVSYRRTIDQFLMFERVAWEIKWIQTHSVGLFITSSLFIADRLTYTLSLRLVCRFECWNEWH